MPCVNYPFRTELRMRGGSGVGCRGDLDPPLFIPVVMKVDIVRKSFSITFHIFKVHTDFPLPEFLDKPLTIQTGMVTQYLIWKCAFAKKKTSDEG